MLDFQLTFGLNQSATTTATATGPGGACRSNEPFAIRSSSANVPGTVDVQDTTANSALARIDQSADNPTNYILDSDCRLVTTDYSNGRMNPRAADSRVLTFPGSDSTGDASFVLETGDFDGFSTCVCSISTTNVISCTCGGDPTFFSRNLLNGVLVLEKTEPDLELVAVFGSEWSLNRGRENYANV